MSAGKHQTKWRPIDRVALVLALSIGSLVNLILVVTMIQIIDHQTPDLTLSENATQIMIAAIGAIAGLLGAYVGLARSERRAAPDDDEPPR